MKLIKSSKRKPAPAAKAPPKKPAATSDKIAAILAAFSVLEGTNRAKVLSYLARDLGRPAVAALMKAAYGEDDGERGKLGMVMKGLFVAIEKRKPSYRIEAGGERGAHVHPVGEALNTDQQQEP
jgi:hypothetical protein